VLRLRTERAAARGSM